MERIFKLRLNDKASLFLVVFVTGSYVVMCNVRYGMNLRYTNMWDLPLRYLAVLSLRDLAVFFPQCSELLVGILVVLLCAFDLRQYHIFLSNTIYTNWSQGVCCTLCRF